ncbi:MAG: hypothetical protein B6I24_00950 [Bacteroidetes bacterium 4572_128]|nr:MAG: hypothetical protein B6I24_00950 [Bacteroidetes bacterium 4572_128]
MKFQFFFIMKNRLKYIFLFSLFWLLIFFISKILFLIYQFEFSKEIQFLDLLGIFFYGMPLDISMISYLLIIPFLFFIFNFSSNENFIRNFLKIYNIIFIFISLFLIVFNLELYRNWGFHIDSTILLYIKTPKEMMASVDLLTSFKAIFLLVFLFSFFIIIYNKIFKNFNFEKNNFPKALIMFVLFLLLIIPIRGGIGIAPVNIGTVYFHKEKFINHSAVNVIWNFMYSISKIGKHKKVKFFEEKEAKKIFSDLYEKNLENDFVLKDPNPNIVFIILESFTAKVIESLDGKKRVTPNFKNLQKDGIFFKNFYANGDRSDKGIVSILSGYPAQATTSIIKFTKKTENLPFISKDLKKLNYKSSFYYGGDINFANLKSYFVNGEFDEIISKKDFSSEFHNSKWGVHDHLLFEKFFEDISKEKEKFFKVLFTLSSHEPFDVPMKKVFHGDDEENRFLNSVYYTDKCIGDFFDKIKKTKFWGNTLFILLADHGSRLPGNTANFEIKKFHIPMLWLGGVLKKKDTIINLFSSQTDIAKTLMSQLNIENKNYFFSKNIFSRESKSFSFYTFNDGFAFINDENQIIFDNIKKDFLLKNGINFKENEKKGKAYFQILNNDFSRR